MTLPDYLAITCALVVALWADRTASRAYRASVICALAYTGDWVRAIELRDMFGPGVYPVLRRLHVEGLVERETRRGGPERGHYDDALYRWIDPEPRSDLPPEQRPS